MRAKLIQRYIERQQAGAISEQVRDRSDSVDILEPLEQGQRNSTIPIICRRELQLGRLLGTGSFSEVYAVKGFKKNVKCTRGADVETSSPATQGRGHRSLSISSDSSVTSPAEEGGEGELQLQLQDTGSLKSPRYAVKMPKSPSHRALYRGKDKNIYTEAAAALHLEAKYLSVFDHPNIIKIRGMGSESHPFIIMDRLDDTLDQRILRWRQEAAQAQPGTSQSARGGDAAKDLLKEKADYALQIAQAVNYLHERRIIVRDIKPANIGFKTDGCEDVVQLFDFGMCRELPKPPRCDSNKSPLSSPRSYRMSFGGSLRYMAVEIVNSGEYCLSADVYSWAMLSFEMFTLEKPFASICTSPALHERYVCREGGRPDFPQQQKHDIHGKIPMCLRNLIQAAWSQEALDRPDMASVCTQLQAMKDRNFEVVDAASSPAAASAVPNRKFFQQEARAKRNPGPIVLEEATEESTEDNTDELCQEDADALRRTLIKAGLDDFCLLGLQ